jgi:hypothetical protein
MLVMKRLGSDANVLDGSGPILASSGAMALAGQGVMDRVTDDRRIAQSGRRSRCGRSIDTKPDIDMKPEVENRHQLAGRSLSKATPEAASRRVEAARLEAARLDAANFDPAPLRQVERAECEARPSRGDGILSGRLTAGRSRFLISG